MSPAVTLMAAANVMLAPDAYTALHDPFAHPIPPNLLQPNGPSDRKARKARARELTRLREEEIRSGVRPGKTRRGKRRGR